MSFYSQYELLEPIPGGKVKSFKARQIASGRTVLVHLLVAGCEGVERELDDLTLDRRALILDRGTHEGTGYVVTEILPANVDFEEWLTAPPLKQESAGDDLSRRGKWSAARIMPAWTDKAAAAPEPVSAPGEFTSMFQSPPAEGATQTLAHAIPLTAEPAPEAPPPPEPGEFTLRFRAPSSATQLPESGAAPPPPNPPPRPESSPSSSLRRSHPRPNRGRRLQHRRPPENPASLPGYSVLRSARQRRKP